MNCSYGYWKRNQNEKNITVYDNGIARVSSIDEAVFIRRIIYLWEKYKHNGEMYIIPKKFAIPIGMSPYGFRKIVKKWETKKILSTKNKGLPLKKWYKLDEGRLAKYLSHLKELGGNTHLNEIDKICYRKQQDKVIENDKIYNRSESKSKTISKSGGKRNAATLDLNETTSFDEEYAKRLEGIIGSSMSRRVTLKRWVNEVRDIRVKDGVPKKEMKTVLKWYKKHYNDKFTPRIYRAADFREKFRRIEDAMKRDVEDAPKEIVVSDEAKKLAKDLSDEFAWPKGSATQLAETIQISLDNYKEFHGKVRVFLWAWGVEKRLKMSEGQRGEIIRFHKCLWDALDSPKLFVRWWMCAVNSDVRDWPTWNGNLIAMAFDVKAKRFQQYGRQIATDYCGSPERFDRYMKVLYSK